MQKSLPLTEYKAQGLGHIAKLGGIVTAGTVLVSVGGNMLFAAPLALATVYQLFRSAGRVKDPDWCQARDELWTYKLSPKHSSIADDYEQWCKDWGHATINGLIEPMIGNCAIANFTKSEKHPYYGLRGILVYDHDDDDLPPLTPHDYVTARLKEREAALSQDKEPAIDVPAQEVSPDTAAFAEPEPPAPEPTSEPIGYQVVTDAPAIAPVTEPELPPESAVPTDAAIPTNAAELLQRLESECPALLKLVKAPPIRLVGLQRTGKSTFARKLALLRKILLPGHHIQWATPHLEHDNPLPAALNPIGYRPDGRKDFPAIERAWDTIQNQIDLGQHPNRTIVWDEFGSYDAFQNQELLGVGLRSLLREATKHEYYPILILHGDQTAFCPGVANILTTLKQSTVKVETVGEQADAIGTMRPTGVVKIYGINGEFKQFKVPDWLSESFLLSLLPVPVTQPANQEPQAQPEPPPPSRLYAPSQDARQQLEKMFDLPTETVACNPAETTAPPGSVVGLDPQHSAVLTYIFGRKECEVGAVKNWAKTKRGLNLLAADVDEILINLMELKLIETFTDGPKEVEHVRCLVTGNEPDEKPENPA